MVFVRVNLIRDRLTAEQKKELGAKLVQAVADVELLVNNTRHQEMSWVQYYQFDLENWYAPGMRLPTCLAPIPTRASNWTSSPRGSW